MPKPLAAFFGAVLATAGSVVVLASPAAATPVSVPFAYTGGVQSWVVPAGVHVVEVEAFGAQGGESAGGVAAGFGGRTQILVEVTPGETLRVLVGGQGGVGTAEGIGGSGGFNGGGSGGNAAGSIAGNGGGGASDVRRGGILLAHRVAVAGGGGGGSPLSNGEGGDGGGSFGAAGSGFEGGGGGTPSSGGAADEFGEGTPGSLGRGGDGSPGSTAGGGGGSQHGGSGGGGGYFGGGGGGYVGGAGGGGSGFDSTGFGSTSFSTHTGHGEVTITYETPETPPGAPTGVSAAPGNGQATVSFSPPASDGGAPISGYTAHCEHHIQNEEEFFASGTGSPLVVTGLTNGEQYECDVLATNVEGDGPASSPPVTVTPQAVSVPGAPTGVSAARGNAKATVSFTPPASDGGSPILDYTATCGTKSATGTASPLVVTGLTNGVTVACTVTARNAQGTGPASAPPVSVKPATVPGAPQNVSAIPGNAQATVKFSKPLSNGGSGITSYRATCGTRSKTGTGSPLVVANLANGITVSCTVKATNVIGTGPASSPPVAVTPRPGG